MAQIAPWVNTLCSYKRDQGAKAEGGQGVSQDHVARTIALGDAEWRLERGRTFGCQFLRGLAEGQRLGLGEQVGHQQIVLIAREG